MIFTCLTPKLATFFSLLLTPLLSHAHFLTQTFKTGREWITAYSFSRKNPRKLVTFLAFSLLIIAFDLLPFTLNSFSCSIRFLIALSDPNMAKLCQAVRIKQLFWAYWIISLDNVSITMIYGKKVLTMIPDAILCELGNSLIYPLILNHLHAFLKIDYTIETNQSQMTSFPNALHSKTLGTWSKAVSKATNGKHKFFFSAIYFSCDCFRIKITFLVPCPGMKPNWISSMTTCLLNNFLITPSVILRISSVFFSHLLFYLYDNIK